MTNLPPPFDPEKARVLKKLAENPCVVLSKCEELYLESELYFEPPTFTPPPRPRFTQLSLFDFE